MTEAAKTLVSDGFAKAGITIYKEGKLDAGVIQKDKLIDNHYYAIANKVGCAFFASCTIHSTIADVCSLLSSAGITDKAC